MRRAQERSAKRDDRIARPRRAQTCERSEVRAKRPMRMCPQSWQIFLIPFTWVEKSTSFFFWDPMAKILEHIYMKFMCKFEYDWPNSFREICTEKWNFFSIMHVRMMYMISQKPVVWNENKKYAHYLHCNGFRLTEYFFFSSLATRKKFLNFWAQITFYHY